MSTELVILLTSAGRRQQLLECFREDARQLRVTVRMLAADAKPELSAACQVADGRFAVPRCTAPDYIPALLEICRRERVGLLVPTIDTELLVLAQHQQEFAAVGTRVVVSAPRFVALARDKGETMRFLSQAGVNVPQTRSLAEFRHAPAELRAPLIAKPAGGSSSVGLVRGRAVADFAGLDEASYLVQELWEGREYTVNMFFDRAGDLRCAVPHLRIETRGGEVSKGRTERVPQLIEAAEKIAEATGAEVRGPICFQAIVNAADDYAVFEINARFGGGFPLAHRAGGTFSRWLLEEALGGNCSADGCWREGVTMLRYDAAVFLDE